MSTLQKTRSLTKSKPATETRKNQAQNNTTSAGSTNKNNSGQKLPNPTTNMPTPTTQTTEMIENKDLFTHPTGSVAKPTIPPRIAILELLQQIDHLLVVED